MEMQTNTESHKEKRLQLANELREKSITDENVLRAIEIVPRHLFFVNDVFSANMIYADKATPIGHGQTISRPYTAAFQAQSLQIKPNDKVLEIGTGSGYLAALLCEMGAEIYTTERIRELFDRANNLLNTIGYEKVSRYWHDGSTGFKTQAPFDKIISTVYFSELPKELLKQLKIDGIIVFPYGNQSHCSLIRITKKSEDQYETEELSNEFMFSPVLSGTVRS